jgi:hypothetical protein
MSFIPSIRSNPTIHADSGTCDDQRPPLALVEKVDRLGHRAWEGDVSERIEERWVGGRRSWEGGNGDLHRPSWWSWWWWCVRMDQTAQEYTIGCFPLLNRSNLYFDHANCFQFVIPDRSRSQVGWFDILNGQHRTRSKLPQSQMKRSCCIPSLL